MSCDLKNKVVLITGGSTGIGAEVIELLLNENVKHVANLDVAEDSGVALQNKLNNKHGVKKVTFFKCDVTNDSQLFAAFDAIVKEQGYIDVVINNAGIMNDAKDKYKKEIAVNVTALTTSSLKALELMRKDEGGKGGIIMNMSSIAALHIDPLLPIYFGTKSYVLQFSSCLGLPDYYTRTGVRVIAICFGATATSLLSKEKLGHFDTVIHTGMMDILTQYRSQAVESAAKGVIEALKKGESGSTWLSIADKPVRNVTDVIKKGYGLFSTLVFECFESKSEMAYSLNGKIAFVTGGASGIGAALVKRLLEEDVKHVAVLDAAEEAGLVLQNELNTKFKENKVSFIKCDVTDKERFLEAFEKVRDKNGNIDLVINSAGILDDTPESYVREININLISLITSSLHAWNTMNKEKGGSGGTIINFSSIAAISKIVFMPVYSATKSAVLKFSTCLGDDEHYSKSGVRVMTMCFGVTDTPILKNSTKLFDESVKGDLDIFKLQSPESAAKAVIEVYKKGASGSVWLSTTDKPALDVTKEHDKSIELFNYCVYD
ncbi:uncharacterized protein LOC123878933 [Maniola jurtina]|uniref:uncharacterized protein LOC123878933 n=1 Tax=Maniola jurtina TaxID=191418 RepID=UPI001E688B19|nr:uncharacterized protein LOC123878933 [Maniola jurtina]